MKNSLKIQAGQVVAIAVILLALSAVFIPLLTMLFRKESKDVVKYKSDNAAYNAARLAMEKVEWRFSQDASLLHDAMVGTPRTGFQGETEHLDVEGIAYRVRLASAAISISNVYNRGRTLVEVKAWPRSNPSHSKSLRAHFEGPLVNGPLWIGETSMGLKETTGYNQIALHWGPATSGRATVSTFNWRGYPRFYSGLSIPLFSTTTWTVTSTLATSDMLSYWPNNPYYSQNYNVATVDFEYYKARAQSSRFPSTGGGGTYDCINQPIPNLEKPIDSGYCEAQIKFVASAGGYEFRSATSVLMGIGSGGMHYLAGVRFLDIEAVLIFGPIDILGPSSPNGNIFQATIPANAHLEYQHPNGQTIWAAGSPSMNSVYQTPSRCCYPVQNTFLRSVVYMFRELSDEAPKFTFQGSMLGALVTNVKNPSLGNSAGATVSQIYYDPDVARKAVLKGKIERKTWEEVTLTW